MVLERPSLGMDLQNPAEMGWGPTGGFICPSQAYPFLPSCSWGSPQPQSPAVPLGGPCPSRPAAPHPAHLPPCWRRPQEAALGLRRVDPEQVGGGDVEVVVAVGWGEDSDLRGQSRGSDPGPLVLFLRDASLAAAPVAEQPREAASASPTCFSSSTEPGLSSPCLSSSSRRCTVPGISPAGEDSPVSAGAAPGSPEPNTATLTCRVPEHGTSVNIGPGQRLDHHGHAGDLVLRELLQGRLHTQTLVTPVSQGSPAGPWDMCGQPSSAPSPQGARGGLGSRVPSAGAPSPSAAP